MKSRVLDRFQRLGALAGGRRRGQVPIHGLPTHPDRLSDLLDGQVIFPLDALWISTSGRWTFKRLLSVGE